ncbi:hypothetical protein BDN72DRAFT_726664, partial [Pluteus cervinus]
WILNALTPSEMRDRILRSDTLFCKELVEYLESTHSGEYLTGTQEDVLAYTEQQSKDKIKNKYVSPIESLPEPPPSCICNSKQHKANCPYICWLDKYKVTVDDIVSKSNIHKCGSNINKDGSKSKRKQYTGCMDNIWGKCRARFPRSIFQSTKIDFETGTIYMKKLEEWINTFTPVLSYLFRCNTDVTSLKSGTAINSVAEYVTNYITKSSLKTYTIFEIIRSVFQQNITVINGDMKRKDKARKLMTRIVNLLSAKMEMGSPMICMYLLGNPDHYTNAKFTPFYWRIYVNEAKKSFHTEGDNTDDKFDKFALFKNGSSVVGISVVYDYVYRPRELEDISLYDFIASCKREGVSRNKNAVLDYAEASTLNESDMKPLSSHFKQTWQDLDPGLYPFLSEHPLSNKSALRMSSKKQYNIPNFIGGMLPQNVENNESEYHLTMLVLFRPWRTGWQLKARSEEWMESFNNYTFHPRHTEVMKFINVRHECKDAADDYYAQMKASAKGVENIYVNDDGFDTDDDIELTNSITMANMAHGKISEGGPKYTAKHAKGIKFKDQMILNGWSTSQGTLHINFHPNIPTAGINWKSVIKLKRQSIIQERSLMPTTSYKPKRKGAASVDGVSIVDLKYLQKKFMPSEYKECIYSTIKQFCLNDEQERAFTIVANH